MKQNNINYSSEVCYCKVISIKSGDAVKEERLHNWTEASQQLENRLLGRSRSTSLSETWVSNRGPLLELFWTDPRLRFQWTQKMSISRALSVFISSAYLSLALSGSVHWSPLLEFTKYQHWTEWLWLFAQRHEGSQTSGSSLVFWRRSKRRRGRKPSLNSPPCLGLQPFILIPVDTCYFFDGKYKALLGNIRRAFDTRAQI